MENNLLAEIFVAQDKIGNCLAVSPPINPSYSTSSSKNTVQPASSSSSPSSSSSSNGGVTGGSKSDAVASPQVAISESQIADPMACAYLVTVEDAIQREVAGGLISKSKYVVYGLSLRRLIDGVEHKVYHRFRDIKTLYYNLMMEFEDIEYNAAIKFPSYEAKWSMSSNQNSNPNSELVVRRRADLQVFFYELFKHYPFLFNHPRVQEFFQIRTLHASSVSSFSTHIQSQEVIDSPTKKLQRGGPSNENPVVRSYSKQLDLGWEYDVSQGRLINTDTWQEATPPPRPMSYVDFSKFNEWYESKSRKI
jgi:hypothetical protein